MSKGNNSEAPRWNLTIHDVAHLAEVSPMTVSRVINGKSGVSPAKRERVARIISEVGFQPHIGAQSMRHTCGDSVGVIFSTPIEDSLYSREIFFSGLVALIYQVFGKDGDFVCLDLNPYAKSTDENYARGLWQQRYGACVVAGPLALHDKTILRVHSSGRPYVAFGRLDSLPEISCATVDFDLGAYMSAKFLLSRGHKRIAMLMTFDGFQPGEERKRGYYRALAEAGIAPDPSLIRAIPYGASQVSHGTYHLLQHLEATAFIDCSGAESAAGLRDGARRAGRVFGEDVEAVVWTYTNTAPVLEEAAAHIWLPSREAATEGLELLADWIHGRRNGPIHVVYPPTMFHTGAERNTANHAAAQPDTASSVFSRAG